MRRLVAETTVEPRQLMLPMFVAEGLREPRPIRACPVSCSTPARRPARPPPRRRAGARRRHAVRRPRAQGRDRLRRHSTPRASSTSPSPTPVAEAGDDLLVMSDLCLDEFTDHGHCGVLDDRGRVDNDATLEIYAAWRRPGRGRRRRRRPQRNDGRPGRRDPLALDGAGHQDVRSWPTRRSTRPPSTARSARRSAAR